MSKTSPTNEDKNAAAKVLSDLIDKVIAADPASQGDRLKQALDTLWLTE